MGYKNSYEKVILTYLRALTKEEFTYKNKTYKPLQKIRVSTDIFKYTTCYEQCGACCQNFSTDYLPTEQLPISNDKNKLVDSVVEFNSKQFIVKSFVSLNKDEKDCPFQDRSTGWCTIHKNSGFTCDFELIRFSISEKLQSVNIITRPYGRGWNMLRCDGVTRGVLCTFHSKNEKSIKDTIRKLHRLKDWFDFFGIDSHITDIIHWAENDILRQEPFIFDKNSKKYELL
jgi:hypothetical protein